MERLHIPSDMCARVCEWKRGSVLNQQTAPRQLVIKGITRLQKLGPEPARFQKTIKRIIKCGRNYKEAGARWEICGEKQFVFFPKSSDSHLCLPFLSSCLWVLVSQGWQLQFPGKVTRAQERKSRFSFTANVLLEYISLCCGHCNSRTL